MATVRARAGSVVVTLAVTAAVAMHAVFDSDGFVATTCYLGVLVGAGVGAWVGAERAPRGQRRIARLIALGVTLTATGDVLWSVLDLAGAETDVSVADVPWFGSYVALCVALWLVLGRNRAQRGGRVDLDFVIDVVTIVVVTVLVFWSLSIKAIVVDDTVSPLVRRVWAAYPVADAVLLALVIRMLISRTDRESVDPAFAMGALLWLAADIAYLEAPAGGGPLTLMDAAWMVGPVLIARAAWRVGRTQDHGSGPLTIGGPGVQLGVAIGPLLVPPALEIVADLRGEPDQTLLLFTGTAVLIALAVVRTARLMRSEERARRELEEARDSAMEASRAKSMFLANMSHEIRTPLTTVIASAEMLEETVLSDAQRSMVQRVNRSGQRLESLVEGILDLSRIEAGQTELDRRAFDLHHLAADIADAYVSRAAESGIEFEWQVDQAVPSMAVGDPGRLFQVVTNVLNNALKFTHEGHVGMTIRRSPESNRDVETGAFIDFVVDDTGIGIAEEHQESVFESFRQVDGSTTRRYGGSGLGLAICRDLTRLMGGSITLRSQLGAGSTFVISVPLVCPEEAPDPAGSPAPPRDDVTGRSRQKV